jgi:hypothetical protein
MTDTPTRTAAPPTTPGRSPLRSIAVPTEHGGWGLTAEPVLLGLAVAATATAVDPAVGAGAVSVAGVVAVQRITARRPAPAKVVGIRQTALGLAVVAATTVGIHLT